MHPTMRLRLKNEVHPVFDLVPASCYDSAAATQAVENPDTTKNGMREAKVCATRSS